MSDPLGEAGVRLKVWLFDKALPLWWRAGADHRRGGFFEGLDLAGDPVADDRRTRVQARQIYVYATAGERGWDGPWREAVEHGLAYLLGALLRPDGMVRALVNAEAKAVDETAMLYDQAFALFALAAAYRVLPGRNDLQDAARRLVAALSETRRHAGGGFREAGAHPFQANAHMHLLEAALAWEEASGETRFSALADEIATLALTRFIDGQAGFLREFFDDQWRPAAGDDGRLIEPGHQFEWAGLLARWGRRRDRADARLAAERLYAAGLRGVDPGRGVAVNALWDDFSVRDGSARLWPQTEWLKAALWLAPGDPAEALRAIGGLEKYFATPVAGLWRDKLDANGAFVEEFAPASSFYHIVCALDALWGALGEGAAAF